MGSNPRRDPGGVIPNWARSILRMFIDIPRQKNIPDFGSVWIELIVAEN